MRSAAAFSASRSAAPAATTTSTIRFRPRTTTGSRACSSTPSTPNTRSRPKAIVDDYKAKEKALKLKREMLSEYTAAEARQLAETLAFQSAKYMKAAWQVTGEPKKDKLAIVDKEKLDYELFDRWLAFLQKKPVFYPFLKDWQSMVARGGTAKEADTLADAFQELLIGVVLEQREVKKENDIIKARALPTAKPKEPANLPNEFITNDDFCPGCGLELRSMTTERTALWGDVFIGKSRSRRRAREAGAARAAALHRLGTRATARRRPSRADRRPAQGRRGDGEGAAGEVRLCSRRPRRREAGRSEGAPARQSHAAGRHGAARFPLGAAPRARDLLERQRPARARAHDHRPADGAAGDGQPRLEGTFRNRPGQHAEQLRRERRAAHASGAARLPGAIFRRTRAVDQGAAPRDHAECGVSVERGQPARGVCQRQRQPALLARQPPSHERRADSRRCPVRLRMRSTCGPADRR